MRITELKPIDLSLAQSKPALIAVSPVVSIQTALNLMQTKKITSLPVFSHNGTKVVSIVNLFDILLYLLGDSSNKIQKDKFPLSDPVENTLRAFASGVHRSLVVDYNDESNNPWLLSQTDIIRHIGNHPECIEGLIDASQSISQVGFLQDKTLVTVPESQPALSVYHLMAEKNLGGMPIVDSQTGNFVDDLCLEDLPGANLEEIDQLVLPCGEYVMKTSRGHAETPTATADASLREILDTMVKKDTHRVWILQDKKVIGVVTMSDVIGRLCEKAY
ncbi:AMP-activated serine/threonine-protein kinase regulatory subunit [Apophysomyces ossiformis]|uniref:AMP-activated serine/threonine-protein kinase regulatory subunit n=1 Tax=Apophysomyces ossiformis TaxID=679940 RepID=A0A8H7BTI8_9FUNG|nr:AMP-activated serine/threonine-protein kinase regulatory subunit [Apophysomyces ossiformis]